MDNKELLKEINSSFGYATNLADYLQRHIVADNFVWLLKLRYSDKESIKKKNYRKDILLQEYLKENKISISKIKNNLTSPDCNKDKFIYYLNQGWYNELATEYPFGKDYMNIGTNITVTKKDVELFPSWYIVKNYYSIYSYYTSLVFSKEQNVRTMEHRKPTQHFNNTLLNSYSNFLIFYPFSIIFPSKVDMSQLRKTNKEFWKYKYSACPRNTEVRKKEYVSVEEFLQDMKAREYCKQNKSIYKLEEEYYQNLEDLSKRLNQKSPVNIIDILYDFRIWSNYVGNDTILNLRSGGYIMHLEKNLSTILFFVAMFSELLGIAILGEENYISVFMKFYNDFIVERPDIYKEWHKIPHIRRMQIYEHLGFIKKLPEEIFPPVEDIAVLL